MKGRINKFSKIVSLCLTLAIAGTMAYGGISYAKLRSDSKRSANMDFEVPSVENIKPTNEVAVQPEPTSVARIDVKESIKESIKEEAREKADVVYEKPIENLTPNVSNIATNQFVFNDNDMITWPVNGGVLMGYSVDNTIWFKTLGQYKINDGLVIAANVGDEIYAGASGVVTDVRETVEYGLVISLDIGGGYEMIYGQVNNSENLKEGTVVLEGEVIGTVANPSRFFVAEGANIFFKMNKDGASVNPIEYIEE